MRLALPGFVLSLLISLTPISEGHPLEVIPVGHWAYGSLSRLAAAGLIPLLSVTDQPLTRAEITRLVDVAARTATGRAVPPGMADELEALRREFGPSTAAEGVRVQSTAGGAAAGGGGLTLPPSVSGRSTATLGTGAAGRHGLLWVEGGLQDGSIELTRGYASAGVRPFSLQAGRELLWWGSSPRASLYLGDHAGALDLLRLTFEVPPVRLVKFASRLSDTPTRYLVGTRLDVMLSDKLRIGLTELAIAQPSVLLFYWSFNPLPVLLTNYIDAVELQQWAGTNDNPLGGLDFDYRVRPGLTLYGQLLIDDISAAFPNRIGGMLGVVWLDPFRTGRTSLRVEYSGVTNWTYTDMSLEQNHYLLRGRPLGHWLGNDADDLYLELSHVLGPEVLVAGWLSRTRHGEGRVGSAWTTVSDAWERWWLSGVVETRYAVGGRYERRGAGTHMLVWVEVGHAVNRNNLSGATGWDYRLGARVSRAW